MNVSGCLTIHSNVTESGSAVILDVGIRRIQEAHKHWDGTSVHELLAVLVYQSSISNLNNDYSRRFSPEWVIFNKAPVAFRCTRISFERASRVRGTKAPDLAILVLLSSEIVTEINSRENSAPRLTVGGEIRYTTNGIALHFDVGTEHLTDQWFKSSKFYN